MVSPVQSGSPAVYGYGLPRNGTNQSGATLEVSRDNEAGSRKTEISGQLRDGRTVQRVATTEAGVKTVATTLSTPAGQTYSIDRTLTRNADGSVAVSGAISNANGATTSFSGSISRDGDSVQRAFDVTNPQGAVAHVDITKTPYSEGTQYQVQGTNFSGEEFAREASRGDRGAAERRPSIDELA